MQTDPVDVVRLVDAHEATSYRPCKLPDCADAVVQTHGPYGGLCARHRDEARITGRQSEIGRAGGQASGAARRAAPAKAPTEGYEGLARQLVAVGRDLDRAKARYRPARDVFEAAMTEWRAAVQRIAAGPGV